MKVYKVTVDGIEYNVQLTPETAEEIGATLIEHNKAAAAANKAEKPAVPEKDERPRRKPGPKPKQKAGE